MGRVLKRVPLDFQWEIGRLWTGYVNPHEIHECKECGGQGWSKEYSELKNKWYSWYPEHNPQWKPNPFREGSMYDVAAWSNNLTEEDVDALLKAGRLWDFTRVPINDEQKEVVKKKIADGGNSWLPFDNGYIPTPQEVNEWALKGIGHDSLNCSIVIEARLEKEGKPLLCSNCNGENWQSEKAKELYEDWKNYDPPYRNVDKTYKEKRFDHSKFWDWCRAKVNEGHSVFVSEYAAPDGFECVWEKELWKTHPNQKKKPTEKLFVFKK